MHLDAGASDAPARPPEKIRSDMDAEKSGNDNHYDDHADNIEDAH
jgi:hypothetical protein